EVMVGLRVSGQLRVVVPWREHQWSAAGPASHQLGGKEFLRVTCGRLPPQESAEGGDILVEAAIGEKAAVAAEPLRLWEVGWDEAAFVGIAEHELARLGGRTAAGRRREARARAVALRDPIPMTPVRAPSCWPRPVQ